MLPAPLGYQISLRDRWAIACDWPVRPSSQCPCTWPGPLHLARALALALFSLFYSNPLPPSFPTLSSSFTLSSFTFSSLSLLPDRPQKTRKRHDAVWVVVDRLTKSAHFIPVRMNMNKQQLVKLYTDNIVRLHGTPLTIVSDRDSRFTSRVWKEFQEAMGTELRFSTAFHPQTDGQSERTIQVLEDLLRSCILDWQGSWEDHLPLVEFAYNNSYQTTIGMAPFEALYGRPCRSPSCWLDTKDPIIVGPELIEETAKQVELIRKRMKEAQDRQKSYADMRRRPLEFDVGDSVFLKISPVKGVMRFGKSGKLSPRFVGPFEILKRIGEVAYQLALPPTLTSAHDVFHVSMLKKYIPDASHKIDFKDLEIREDMSYIEKPVKILDRKDKVLRTKTIPLVKVLWRNHALEEATWEVEADMKEKYPELFD